MTLSLRAKSTVLKTSNGASYQHVDNRHVVLSTLCGILSALVTNVFSMRQQTFTLWAGVVFSVVTLVHLARIIQGWSVSIGGWSVPMWCSYVAVVVAGYLALHGLKLSGKL